MTFMQGYGYFYLFFMQCKYMVAFLIWEDEYTIFKEEWTMKVINPKASCLILDNKEKATSAVSQLILTQLF